MNYKFLKSTLKKSVVTFSLFHGSFSMNELCNEGKS